MKRVIAIAAGAAAVAALAAGCSSKSVNSGSSPSPTPSATAPAPGGSTPAASGAAVLKTASTPLGTILVDGSGRTLYLFKADTGTTSTCNGACAQAWPPDLTNAKPQETGLNAALVGTTVRADHSTEVTYHGHPLYYFADDSGPGQTNGQGLTAFGGTWYVVAPDGSAVTSAPATAPSPSSTGSTGGGYGY